MISFAGFNAIESDNGNNRRDQNLRAVEASGKIGLPSAGASDCNCVEIMERAVAEFENHFNVMWEMICETRSAGVTCGFDN